jgi:hypothetical protein
MKALRLCIVTALLGAAVISSCTDSKDPQLLLPGANITSSPATITLVPISTPFNSPVGIDHHTPTNKIVMSVYYPNGSPYNFELVNYDGTRAQFSNISGFTDEIKIATVKDNLGGFTPGELFTGNGVDGQIVRISADGTTVQNPWVDLPGTGNGLMRGSLHVDRTGVWGGDLLVCTTTGQFWRINSAGTPTMVAMENVHFEGLLAVPNDPAYGPWAGTAIMGAEGIGATIAISPDGTATYYYLGISPEDIDLIPDNENFFGVNFGSGQLMGAPASAFDGMEGDILITQEFPGYLWHVKWNGSSFDVDILAEVPQWEHVTFSTAGIVEIPPIGASLDIHPTSCPNPFNLAGLGSGNTNGNAGGVLPAAIIGSDNFDVADIDPSTILLEGVAPIRTRIEDVNRPAGDDECACTSEGPDGIDDLTLKFSRRLVAETLGAVANNDVITLTLTGELNDGTPFTLTDCVIIRNADKLEPEAKDNR